MSVTAALPQSAQSGISEWALKEGLSVNLADLHQPTTYLQSDVGRFDLMSYFANQLSSGLYNKSHDGREPQYWLYTAEFFRKSISGGVS